ncbi:hybrid sensor histidine kinase/response regulator [Pelagicoccus mobilis]|uniref:histidine kinase n=1 Tax=Pelagicoccus mobilis TaxID=415221 RepID=A0A934VNE8_9BACT|nr:hybrid sensor histidine kinase/response regulator [Pelagicoccus mobilis]MBK1876142.1 response regulator [Pelagicoccus mobilis]
MRCLLRLTVLSGLVPLSFASPLQIHHLENEQQMDHVSSMWRDHLGYLWIGSERMGLMRYDGTDIVRYGHSQNDDSSLLSDFVTDVFEDSRNRLWVATRRGLDRYDRGKDSFRPYLEGEQSVVVEVNEDSKGRLWVLRTNSILLYDEESDRFESHYIGPQGEKGHSFTSFVEDSEGMLWIAEAGTALWRFDTESLNGERFEVLSEADGTRKKLYRDLDGVVWVAARDAGLFSFNPESLEVKRFGMDPSGLGTSGSNVRDVVEYPAGQLVIAVDQGGLNLLDKETGTFTYQRLQDRTGYGLSNDGLVSLYLDEEGILWIGTSHAGIDFHNPLMARFSTIIAGDRVDQLRATVVGCVFEDAIGRIWMADGDGLTWLDPDTKRLNPLPRTWEEGGLLGSDIVRQVDQSSDGRIWVATWDGGIDVLIEEEGQFRLDTELSERMAEFEEFSIWDIEVDRADRVWIAAAKGEVFLYDTNGNFLKRFDESIKEGGVVDSPAVTELENGDVLLTTEHALYRFDEVTFSFEEIFRVHRPTVVAWEEERDMYCLGTVDQGVFLLNRQGDELARIGHEDGLSNLFVQGLECDLEGALWIATNDGLFHYQMGEQTIERYDENEGLQGNIYFTDSSCKTRDGRLYFGGANGVSSFDPKSIRPNPYLPYVSIDRITLFGEEISTEHEADSENGHSGTPDELRLKWDQNFLRFDYSAVNMTYPKSNRFAYILEGFDQDWTYGDASLRWANYTNVDPGLYTFRVKAANSDGIWNEEGASIRIVITPPFWQRSWFYFLVTLLVVASVYLYIVFRERRLKLENARLEKGVKERTKVINKQKTWLAEKNGLLEDQKEELETQKGQLLLHQNHLEEMIARRTEDLLLAKDKAESADRLKSQFLANLSHEVRTPLNAITGFSHLLHDDLDAKSREEYIEYIEASSDSLLQLIEGIIDYSMLASGEMELRTCRFGMNGFLEKLFKEHLSKFQKKGLKLDVDNKLEEFDLYFEYDDVRLKQILENLLSNALKFTESGSVRLRVELKGNALVLSVRDTGSGIAEDELDTVFEKFVKLAKDELAARRGVGLGLAIAKSLTELMGGDLSVTSEYGKGSTFSLTLPCGEGVVWSSEGKPFTGISRERVKDKESSARVLLVEDEEANYRFLEIALEGVGLEVRWARGGEQALEILKNDDRFDFVLLDLRMPGMDGYSVLAWIRENVPHLRVVAQTAFATKSDQSRIKEAGFDGYLPKPIGLDRLQALVDEFRT